ncbi:hypothetical protein [uncultured Methanobrevibacter sp.]|uniref:hypothetical protein n=1 Tax=uncultured Methanobrevibacter sp. TaxID=253161 RepID=UPI0025CC8DBC|nr:hypothetical protein [uncultured Methanobrevibacter sp.]
MGIRSAAKKVGKAIVFMKLFEDLKANRGLIEEDIAKLKEIIEEWKAEAPNDLNLVLASILVKAEEGTVEDPKEEFEKAKAEYHAEDEDILPWFENQIEVIEAEKEAEAEAEAEE